MEDGAFTPNTMLEALSDSSIDFNLMDEIFYDGFWLETTNDSNFWQPSPSPTPNHFFPSSHTPSNSISPHQAFFKEAQDLDIVGPSSHLGYPPPMAMDGNQPLNNHPSVPSISLVQPQLEESDSSRRLWVGPNRNTARTVPVKKKLVQAINHLKESLRDTDVLIQIWVPVKKGGKQVLTTNNQPFSFNPNFKNLAEYRDVSQTYNFVVDEGSKEFAGLPGRVFLKKLPEWTPDVRFFRREEYPRVNYAQRCDVRGSLALPVFERGSGNCLGVVEIVTTSQKLNYRPELDSVCKALEAVDLKSSNILGPPNLEACTESYQSALMEIKNVLKCVCDTHGLPLAQTWAACTQQGKSGCRHSEENYAHCVSTVDSACYVADQLVSTFHEACSEHHLLKGEGIAGKAFLTNQPCFSEDITVFSKTEYPLAHHARVFNLSAAVAIRLRSTYTGTADYVLEFFLPINCKDAEDQRQMLDSLSSVLQRTCQSLRVVTDQELARETSDMAKQARLVAPPPPKEPSPEASSWVMHMVDSQQKGKGVAVSLDHYKEEPAEFNVTTEWDKSTSEFHQEPAFLEHDQPHNFSGSKLSAEGSGSFCFSSGQISSGAKTSTEKRRTKTEKNISLQVLRQYFAGSLKDAAKSLGVCPTTLKRICRQHGITRWPSRKIKKVGHSLKKLQLVIDSVQGAEGSIQLSSFYNNFPDLVSPNAQETSNLPASTTLSGQLQLANNQPEGTLISPETTTSKSPTSSGSHSSSSSYCCSTGVKQSSLPEDSSLLKRARSDAELLDLGQEDSKLLVRSYSQKIISDHAAPEAQPVPKTNNSVHNEGYLRIKAAFGEEKIRFSLQPHWGFRDLQQEVLRRFNLENGNRVDLKYLDDDNEWVLLTCDADLEECVDIHRSSKCRTVKLTLNQPYYHNSLGSSFGSSGPF